MHELRISGQGYHKASHKYDSSKGPEGKRVKNTLNRRFKTARPFQKMVLDVTEFKLSNGQKVYLEPIMDLYNNQIKTYSITNGIPNLEFALQPLIELQSILPTTGYKITMHTDQGWQYRHQKWRKILKKSRIAQSMSHRARCLDNACIESFFNKLKVEIGDLKQFNSAKKLIRAIETWIKYYNTDRIQMKLGGLSPIEYQQQAA
jgi:transposase InsO family protein